MAREPDDHDLTDNEKRARAHRAEIDKEQREAKEKREQEQREEEAKKTFTFGQTDADKAKAEADRAKAKDAPAAGRMTDGGKTKDAPAEPPPMPEASLSPAPVPEGAIPNIQRYDDGKSPSDIGLSDANSGALTGAGLSTVGRIRRVRDVDLLAIEGVIRGDVRERVPFQCKPGETILVPVEDKPGEWVAGEGTENVPARRL